MDTPLRGSGPRPMSAMRPHTAEGTSSGAQERDSMYIDYLSRRGTETPRVLMRPATAHPTGHSATSDSKESWRQMADLLLHKGYPSSRRVPSLGVLNKGTVCLKDPNSLNQTALQAPAKGQISSQLPPLHTPLATTWIKGHLGVVTNQRNKLEQQLGSLRHSTRVTLVDHLQTEVRTLHAQLNHSPQAFQDVRGELDRLQKARAQLEQELQALKTSTRATRTAELEQNIEMLKAEVLRLMRLLKYAQHLGSDPDALEQEIRMQIKGQMQDQIDSALERARQAEHLAKMAERRLAEALERERELQRRLQGMSDRPAEVQVVGPDPGLEDRLRAEIEARLRAELEGRLREELREGLKDELRQELEDELRAQVEAALRRELEAALRAELEERIRRELEEALRSEVEAQLRAELEASLRQELEAALRREIEDALRSELEAAIRAELEALLRMELEQKLLGMQEVSAAGAAQLQMLLEERDKQLQQATAHAQASLKALVTYMRTKRLPEGHDLEQLQRELQFDVDISAAAADEAVPSLKVAHRVVLSQITGVRDMLVRYQSLSAVTDLELLWTEALQHAATMGLPDVLKQLLALLTAVVQGMRSLPGLAGNVAASIISGKQDGADIAWLSLAMMRSMSGVQDLLVILQDQLDLLRQQQPTQGAVIALHASNMRQLALMCHMVTTEVAQVYGQEEPGAASAGRSVVFVASSDKWLRLSATDAAKLLLSLGHRVAGWLLRCGLEELAVPLCGGAVRAAWLTELHALGSRDGGLEQLLASCRPEPPAPMLVSRLLKQLETEPSSDAFDIDSDQADEERADSSSTGSDGDSGPLPLREGAGSWAERMQKEDIHVAMERYGLVRWSESLWQYGVKTVQQLVDAARDCPAELQDLNAAMCELESARFMRLVRNGQRAVALATATTPVAPPPPRELTEAERLGLELLAAASKGDAITCEELLVERGARPELAVDPTTGKTALIAAAEGGYVDVVTLLLFHNADGSVRDRAGRTALLVAARNLRTATCEKLLSSGKLEVLSSVDVEDDSGRSAVVYACRNCMKDVAVKLVMVGANPEAAQPDADKHGFGEQVRRATVDGAFLRQELFLGAEDGDVARCERAINGLPCGPNVKPRDDGFTPLHAAVLGGHEAVARLLLQRGATPDARYARKTPLVCAAVLGNASMIRLLGGGGADIKRGGYEALVEACQHRQPAACIALLELGAQPLPEAGTGAAARTIPLAIAAFNGMQDVVKAMLDRGVQADTEVRSSPSTLSSALGGFTSLSYACSGSMYEAGTLAVAQLLLQKHADPNKKAVDGTTPLMSAAFSHGGDMVKLLLAAGAAADTQRVPGGRSALMVAAARRGDRGLSAAEALLSATADAHKVAQLCTAVDDDGRSAYDHALASGSSAVARLLEQYSAKTEPITKAPFRTYTGAVAGSAASGSIHKHLLRQAASSGDLDGCRRLLGQANTAGWTADDAADGSGRTPLHLAVVSGASNRKDVVQMLLDAGSDANRMYDYDSCALRDAALAGDAEMVELLLPRSTAASVRRLALHSAVYKRHQDLALVLLSAVSATGGASSAEGRWGSLLHEAAEQGMEEVCSRLLASGADAGDVSPSPVLRIVASRGETGTPLCIAAAALPQSAVDLCSALISRGRGTDVNFATEGTSATPLMFAAAAARHDRDRAAALVRLLLSHGAKVHVHGGVSRRTPLMWAAMAEGDRGLEVVRALLEAAEENPSVDVAEMLRAQDDVGDTAVMLAVGSRSPLVEKEIRAKAEALGVKLSAASVH